jgi:hypothetical protein
MREGDELELHHVTPLAIAPNSIDSIIVHAECHRGGAGVAKSGDRGRRDPASFREESLGPA